MEFVRKNPSIFGPGFDAPPGEEIVICYLIRLTWSKLLLLIVIINFSAIVLQMTKYSVLFRDPISN